MGGDVFAFPVAPGARPARLWPALLLLLLAAAGWAVAHAVDAELLSRLTDAPRSTWPMVAAALLLVVAVPRLLPWSSRGHAAAPPTESLTILPSLGLLLGSSRTPAASDFLPLAHISRVVLNEALEGFGARSYLGIVLHGGREVVVAFPNCKVWMSDLELVHEAIQQRLWAAPRADGGE